MLHGVQDAVRLLVQHLGGRDPGPGRPPQWVLNQSAIGVAAIRPGSLVADLVLSPPSGQTELLDYGRQALETLLNWNQSEDAALPSQVEEKIIGITRTLPENMKLFLGTPDDTHQLELRQTKPIVSLEPEADQEALLYGWLKEINWHNGTAQLHQSVGSYIRLRFDSDIDTEMLRLATRYVEVRGQGRFNQDDQWKTVLVEEVRATRSWKETFDLEEFLSDPTPKAFDPDRIVTIDLTEEEWDSFNRAIREGRDV